MFKAQFTNSKFNDEQSIEEFYEKTFRQNVKNALDEKVRDMIIKYFAKIDNLNDDEKDFPKYAVPEFLQTHYLHEAFSLIEEKLLPDFHRYFSLPKEDEWKQFLETIK